MKDIVNLIIGLIGAAAWTPYILKRFAKPHLRVVPSGQLEIGFTTYGPVMNFTAAIAASKADALITKVTLRIRHENGRQAEFTCTSVQESGGVFQQSTGLSTVHQRQQFAVAIAALKNAVAERKLLCREKTWMRLVGELYPPIFDALRRMQQASPQDWHGQFVASREYQTLMDAYRQHFLWQTGEYSCELLLYVDELKSDITQRYKFRLAQSDLAQLETDLGYVDQEIRRATLDPNRKELVWLWIYPFLESA